jgi:single-strand DNA-binding protein
MLNKAQIIGRVGRDPEVRYLTSGDAVVNVSVATSERWKDKQTGEVKEATEWHRVNFFGRLAEIAGEYIQQGTLIFVEGKIKTRKWTDKDGVERYSTEIMGETMKLLSSKQGTQPQRSSSEGHQKPQPKGSKGSGFDDMDDDIPFN